MIEFSAEAQERFQELVQKYPHKKAALLQALWVVQEDKGSISVEAMEYVANLLDIPPSQVYSVVHFYSMYQTEPIGKYHIQVCRTLSCALNGAESLVKHFSDRLGVKPRKETTPDGLFTLSQVECLASCGTGPMCQINESYYENLTPEKVDQLLEELREQAKHHD